MAAVEDHLQHIQATLDVIDRFNERLDNIHALLEVAIGFVSADTDIEKPSSCFCRPDSQGKSGANHNKE